MRPVEGVPRTATPAPEGDLVRRERVPVRGLDEPVGVLAEQPRALLRYEGGDPDRRLEPELADSAEHAAHVAPEGGPGLQPVPHRRLVTVVDLDVLEPGALAGDDVQIGQDLFGGDARAEAV